MGALHLAIFILISLQAVDAYAQTPNKPSIRLSFRQGLALQGRDTAPALAQVSPEADGSPYLDPADENPSIALPSWSSVEKTTTQPDLIVSNNVPCSPVNHPTTTTTTGGKLKRRGVKQRRVATPKPESFCPLPATTTDTDTHPPKTDGQQPQTEEKGQEQGGEAPHDDGSTQPEELKWPNLFKIPTEDGDSPACFEATNGLMPVGVCESPEQRPEPSRWDVFMQVNRDVDPRAWKLPDSTLAWPGMRECVPHNDRGIWCCRFYTVLIDGSGFGDICWPLTAIERANQGAQGAWQQYMNPLLPGL